MGYLLSRSILFFLRNIRMFGCLRSEWPQGSEVCSYLGFESALGYTLHVDALSLVSCLMLEDTLHYKLHEWVRAVMAALENSTYGDFFIKHGILYKDPVKELIVVPTLMEEEIIRMAHKQGNS